MVSELCDICTVKLFNKVLYVKKGVEEKVKGNACGM